MGLSPYQILIRPIPSGKMELLSKEGKYVFEVHPRANKIMIKEAVSKIFNVRVKDVNIIRVKGERRRSRSGWYKTQGYKKAIVTLEKGFSIPLIEGV